MIDIYEYYMSVLGRIPIDIFLCQILLTSDDLYRFQGIEYKENNYTITRIGLEVIILEL